MNRYLSGFRVAADDSEVQAVSGEDYSYFSRVGSRFARMRRLLSELQEDGIMPGRFVEAPVQLNRFR